MNDDGYNGIRSRGGVAMPNRNHQCLMPEQPPMPAGEQLDPNIVQQALTQAAGGIGDLDQAQNYEQVMNTMRGDRQQWSKDDRN